MTLLELIWLIMFDSFWQMTAKIQLSEKIRNILLLFDIWKFFRLLLWFSLFLNIKRVANVKKWSHCQFCFYTWTPRSCQWTSKFRVTLDSTSFDKWLINMMISFQGNCFLLITKTQVLHSYCTAPIKNSDAFHIFLLDFD